MFKTILIWMITCEIFAPVGSRFGQCEVGMILDTRNEHACIWACVHACLQMQRQHHILVKEITKIHKCLMSNIMLTSHLAWYSRMWMSNVQYHANFTLPLENQNYLEQVYQHPRNVSIDIQKDISFRAGDIPIFVGFH